MTVAFGAIGTGANGSTSVAPSYPTGITVGQLLLCVVTSGATNSETPTTPNGWILLGTGASTDGTFGIDTGPRRVTVFARVADGTESGTLTVNITNGDTCRGTISRFTSSIGSGWALQAGSGNDSTSGTSFSASVGSINWATGDCALVAVGQRVDSATQSAQSLTASGTTFGARTNRATTAVTTGNDHRHVVDTFAAATAGGGSATTTWAYTASAAVSGGVVVVRIREIGNVNESLTVAADQTSTLVFGPPRLNERLTGSDAHGALVMRRAGLAEVTGGAGTFDVTRSESLTVADSQSEVATFSKAQTESLTIAAAQTETATLNSAQSESLTATASQTEQSTVNKNQDESIALSAVQTATSGKSGNQNESIAVSDSSTESSVLPRAVSEALTATESSSRYSTRNVSQAESLTVSATQVGSVNAIFAKQRDEILTVTDSSTRSTVFAKQQAEALSVAATAFAPTGRSVNERLVGAPAARAAMRLAANDGVVRQDEVLTVVDSSTKSVVANRAIAEALSVADSQANKGFNARRNESLTVADSQTCQAILIRNQSEILSLSDSALGTKNSSTLTRNEALTIVDSQTGVRLFSRSTADSLAISDSQTATYAPAPPRINTVLVGERRESPFQAWAMDSTLFAFQNESLTASDSQTALRYASAAQSESLTAIDSSSEVTTLSKTVAESVAISSSTSASKGAIYVKQCGESLTIVDASTRTSTRNVAQDESLVVGASQDRVAERNATIAESLSVADELFGSKQPIYDRTCDESLIATDQSSAAVNHSVFVRQVVESLSVLDESSQVPSLNSRQTELLTINDAVSTAIDFVKFMDEVLSVGATQYLVIGPYSPGYRYDVPGGSFEYDVPGGSYRYDVPVDDLDITL